MDSNTQAAVVEAVVAAAAVGTAEAKIIETLRGKNSDSLLSKVSVPTLITLSTQQ